MRGIRVVCYHCWEGLIGVPCVEYLYALGWDCVPIIYGWVWLCPECQMEGV